MPCSSETILMRARGVSCQAFGDDDEGVVLALSRGQLYSCNTTAISFLTALDGRTTFGQLVDHVAARYAIDRRRVQADLSDLVETLVAEELIVGVA